MTADPQLLHELSARHPIVFFDGHCGLCNASVDWILARDPGGVFRFAPLQGKAAGTCVPEKTRRDLETILVLKEGRLFERSDAVVEILLSMGGAKRVLGSLLRIVPRFLRDLGYRLIARNRYLFYGRLESCRLPTPAERARFLD